MVVYSILLMDLSPTSYCLPKPLLVYGLMLLLSTSLLPSYSDQRKSYSGYVGVGLGIAHGTYLMPGGGFVLADSEYPCMIVMENIVYQCTFYYLPKPLLLLDVSMVLLSIVGRLRTVGNPFKYHVS